MVELTCELKGVESEAEWEAYHAIRERVLWTARGRVGVYDRHHPDERHPAHRPLLLVRRGDPIGVIRVDLEPPVAWFRRVAVREDVQRQGYGRIMLQLASSVAVSAGCSRVCSNVDADAVGFYLSLGFRLRHGEFIGNTVPMERDL